MFGGGIGARQWVQFGLIDCYQGRSTVMCIHQGELWTGSARAFDQNFQLLGNTFVTGSPYVASYRISAMASYGGTVMIGGLLSGASTYNLAARNFTTDHWDINSTFGGTINAMATFRGKLIPSRAATSPPTP